MEQSDIDEAEKALTELTYLAGKCVPKTLTEYFDALWSAFGFGRKWGVVMGNKLVVAPKSPNQPPMWYSHTGKQETLKTTCKHWHRGAKCGLGFDRICNGGTAPCVLAIQESD